ncbi:MAG: hypothetical protein U0223_03345 [Nitrospira sp.]|nr:hypothetical protein [Nitrospira sp.]
MTIEIRKATGIYGAFEATSMEEANLLHTMTEADRGETVSAADLLKQIRRP